MLAHFSVARPAPKWRTFRVLRARLKQFEDDPKLIARTSLENRPREWCPAANVACRASTASARRPLWRTHRPAPNGTVRHWAAASANEEPATKAEKHWRHRGPGSRTHRRPSVGCRHDPPPWAPT